MRSLHDIWLDMPQKTDKGDIHTYLHVYDEIFAPYRQNEINLLEIGLFNGASLRLWEQYFTKAKVYGIDCDEQPHGGMADLRPMIEEGTHNIFIGDATSKEDIDRLFGDIKWDIVIDDGNHVLESQLKVIDLFKDRMNKGGIIVVEDIQDIDTNDVLFESIDAGESVEIYDRRFIKSRYDDVMVVVYF